MHTASLTAFIQPSIKHEIRLSHAQLELLLKLYSCQLELCAKADSTREQIRKENQNNADTVMSQKETAVNNKTVLQYVGQIK